MSHEVENEAYPLKKWKHKAELSHTAETAQEQCREPATTMMGSKIHSENGCL